MRLSAVFAAASVYLFLAGVTHAAKMDFNSWPNGKIINNQYLAKDGVTISADNFTPGHPDIAATFDTDLKNTADLDLQQPWTGGGNLKNHNFTNILIIAQNDIDKNHDGLIDSPNDEGQSQPAGVFHFNFTAPQNLFDFDLLDVDGPQEIGPNKDYVAFFSQGKELARVSFGAFVDPKSKFYDPTVHYANNSANHIQPITSSELGIGDFDRVDLNMGWSTDIDNIIFDHTTVISPEPASLAMLLAPLAFVMRSRRRR
jgi:hypothetical protein